jgi:nucleotide-binding universal stress UspA family protein
MAQWTRICCPVDFSQTSRAALEEAADLARRHGAALTVLHVFEPAVTGEMEASVPELLEATARELERKLAGWKLEAERLGAPAVEQAVISGVPGREIAAFASEGGYDLVVMGTHGRTGLRHLVIGSVAERVIREAHCPVLVVRPRETK